MGPARVSSISCVSFIVVLAGFLVVPPGLAHSPLHEEIESLSQLIERSPADASLYLRRGELHRLSALWERAEGDYDRAALLDPDLARVDFCRAALLVDTGRSEAAFPLIDRAVARGADRAHAHLLRARALVALERLHAAADELGLAIGLLENPKPDHFLERARLLERGGGDDAREAALRALDEGIERLGPLVSLEDAAIALEIAAGRHDAALARLDRIGDQLERKDAWCARRAVIAAAAPTESDFVPKSEPSSPSPIDGMAGPVTTRAAATVRATATATVHVFGPEAGKGRAVGKGGAGTPAAAGAALATVTRGPYLQVGTPASVVVRWRTDVATDSRVAYGTVQGSPDHYVDDATLTTEHVASIGGLAPDTKYFYSVGTTTLVLAGGDAATFVLTPPQSGTAKPTRIWILGDSGGANQPARDVRDVYEGYTGTRHTDLWLMLGDNAYFTGTDSEYQGAVFDMYPSMLRKSVLWPTRGNHEFLFDGPNNDYYDIFSMPTAGEAGGVASGTEAYYSFDYGNIHFVCLDSEGTDRSSGGAMLTWLREDVAATAREWVVAFWHHPPYSKGSHDSDNPIDSGGRMRDMRENALPILDSLGIDLVLTGHSHGYERSFLLDGHYGLSSTLADSMKVDDGDGREAGDGAYAKPTPGRRPHEGTVYTVAGSSSQLGSGTYDHPIMVVSFALYGSVVLDVDGGRLDARFLTSAGAVADSFTVIKGAPVSVNGVGGRDAALRIDPPQPNPSSAPTRFQFSLPSDGVARFTIHDAGGRRVATLVSNRMGAGPHAIAWDGRDERGVAVAQGVYFGRLEHGGLTRSQKFLLVR